jgi:hypothetical protein
MMIGRRVLCCVACQNITTEKSVYLDAHILATPVIADIDNDNVNDIIVPVSYYIETPTVGVPISLDIDRRKYAACGIVVFDLMTFSVKFVTRMLCDADICRNALSSAHQSCVLVATCSGSFGSYFRSGAFGVSRLY